jgi:hypothetical protein
VRSRVLLQSPGTMGVHFQHSGGSMQDSEQEVVPTSSDVSATAPIPLTEDELKMVGGGATFKSFTLE